MLQNRKPDIFDVQTASCNVSGNKHWTPSTAKLAQHHISISLRLISMNGSSSKLTGQITRKLITHLLSRTKDYNLRSWFLGLQYLLKPPVFLHVWQYFNILKVTDKSNYSGMFYVITDQGHVKVSHTSITALTRPKGKGKKNKTGHAQTSACRLTHTHTESK